MYGDPTGVRDGFVGDHLRVGARSALLLLLPTLLRGLLAGGRRLLLLCV